jgi:acetyl esterase
LLFDTAILLLTLCTLVLAKERGNTGISYQVLYYPILGVDFDTESYLQNRDNVFLPRATMQHTWETYLGPKGTDLHNVPTAVPMSNNKLDGLPPALVITAENDVLRSEGEAYSKKLLKAGVPALSVRYQGCGHGFTTIPDNNPQALAAIAQTIDILRKHWSSSKSKL